jgi:hypothetical protein
MQTLLLDQPIIATLSDPQEVTNPCALHVQGNLNGAVISVLISPDGTLDYVPYDFPFIGSDIHGNGIYVINVPGTYSVKLQFQLNSLSQASVPDSVKATLFN